MNVQDFVGGAKELLDYAAQHGGSTLLSWYTFFYICDGILGLLFCSMLLFAMILGLIWLYLSCSNAIKEDRRSERLNEARIRAREEEHELYKSRMNDREQRYK